MPSPLVWLQVTYQQDFTLFLIVPILFFIIFAVVIVAVVKGFGSRGRVQRPLTQDTAFAPPPPPDTVTVTCTYCGTVQKWKEKCAQCGAPMPRPSIPGVRAGDTGS